jgi:hypothetical protein
MTRTTISCCTVGFDRFNLAHFHTVDQVIRQIGQARLGLKTILGASGVEFPFNDR